MPEGDSLRRAEALLAPILDGQTVTDVWFKKIRGHRPRPGQRIEQVNAVGKHLLINFDRNLTLRIHLGMTGSFRVIPPDSALPKSPRLRVVLQTKLGTALCFSAPTIDTFIRGAGASPVDHLGPDLSDDTVDVTEVVKRARSLAPTADLASALLDQRIAAGVGNVFKSEVAFLAGVHPFTPISSLSDGELVRLWRLAHQQLLANRDRNSRKTTTDRIGGQSYVYGRFRSACRRCSSSIEFSPAGEITERSTYWCPHCQPQSKRISASSKGPADQPVTPSSGK
ncbi:MAG: Fpg/Nei family DNA glycosylase [Acidimicrobiales bacterium]|nr:Fpg/Nei family DNA glycosylase [Acidimicrobiales bacterium]